MENRNTPEARETDLSKAQNQQQPSSQSQAQPSGQSQQSEFGQQQQQPSAQSQSAFGQSQQQPTDQSQSQFGQSQQQPTGQADYGSAGQSDSVTQQRSDVEGGTATGQADMAQGASFVGSKSASDTSGKLVEEDDKTTDYARDGQGAPE